MNQTKSLSIYDCLDTLTKSCEPEEQAKAHVKAMNQTMNHYIENILATKNDLHRLEVSLKSEMQMMSSELRKEMGILRNDLDSKIDYFRAETKCDVKTEIQCLRSEMSSHFRTVYWMMAFLASAMGTLITQIFLNK